jgi:hypothetical protein
MPNCGISCTTSPTQSTTSDGRENFIRSCVPVGTVTIESTKAPLTLRSLMRGLVGLEPTPTPEQSTSHG